MATAIKYFDKAKVGHARVTTGVANTDGSGTPTAVSWYGGSAPAADWMLVKVIISATNATGTADIADCLFNIFIDDTVTTRLLRTIDPGVVAAGTTNTSAGQWEVTFGPEFIFPSNVVPEVTVSVTPTAGNVDFIFICQEA